jgi:hypothetical protein
MIVCRGFQLPPQGSAFRSRLVRGQKILLGDVGRLSSTGTIMMYRSGMLVGSVMRLSRQQLPLQLR